MEGEVTRGWILTVVHPVCALLAARFARANRLSVCVAHQPAISNYRHHAYRSIWPADGDFLASRAIASRAASHLKRTMDCSFLLGRGVRVNNGKGSVILAFSMLSSLYQAT
jgi:hypothetical protein